MPVGQIAAARTREGCVVFAVPLDYLVWSESMARVIDGTNRLVTRLPGIKKKQLWLAQPDGAAGIGESRLEDIRAL
ncbi:MAG: hypothetical protein ACREX4_23655 [Gammaproteobacteria bacterium]